MHAAHSAQVSDVEQKSLVGFAMSDSIIPRLLTKEHAAILLNCSQRTIERAVRSGRLHQVQLNRRVVRFREADVVRLTEPKRGKRGAR